MAAGPYDLTTLAAVKAFLGIPDATTTSDVLLQSLISSGSRVLLNELSRGNILSAAYTDRLDGTGWGQSSLLLPRWPVTSIVSLAIGNMSIPAAVTPAANAAQPSGYLLEAWDGVPAGRPQSIDLFGYTFSTGRQNIVASYVAGYLSTDPAVAIPVAPYQLTAGQLYGAWAADVGVSINGVAAVKVTANPVAGQYSVAAGVYTFAAADVGKSAILSYSYVPNDLAQACFQLVSETYTYRGRIGVSSKSLGGQETITYSQKALTNDIRDIIQDYRNVVPFV